VTTSTTFAGKNPFTGQPVAPAAKAKKIKQSFAPVDLATLRIASDPLPERRATPGLKYEALFSQLQVGQCIVCAPDETSKLGHALNTWLQVKGRNNAVKTCSRYETDQQGRVWLLAPVQRPLKSAA
jgi:hypothetical protein